MDGSGVSRVSGGCDLKHSQYYPKLFGAACAQLYLKHKKEVQAQVQSRAQLGENHSVSLQRSLYLSSLSAVSSLSFLSSLSFVSSLAHLSSLSCLSSLCFSLSFFSASHFFLVLSSFRFYPLVSFAFLYCFFISLVFLSYILRSSHALGFQI